MIEKEKFERHLRGTNLSENTISSYLFAIKQYGEQYDDVTQKKLREYKVWLIENYKPKTVNLRLRAINCYLECIGKEKWKLPFVRVQQKAFLENVISEADYEYPLYSGKRSTKIRKKQFCGLTNKKRFIKMVIAQRQAKFCK